MRFLIPFLGIAANDSVGSTSFVTNERLPITAPCPILIPGMTIASEPIKRLCANDNYYLLWKASRLENGSSIIKRQEDDAQSYRCP